MGIPAGGFSLGKKTIHENGKEGGKSAGETARSSDGPWANESVGDVILKGLESIPSAQPTMGTSGVQTDGVYLVKDFVISCTSPTMHSVLDLSKAQQDISFVCPFESS